MIELTETDEQILSLLRANARESVNKLAARLGISSSLVRRRIAYLEDEKVINKYTVVLDHGKVGRRIEAYVLLTVDIDADLEKILSDAVRQKGVREASTLAGDPDALLRLRVDDPIELRDTVVKIRKLDGVTGTKTLVALGRIRHVAKNPLDDAP